MKVLYYDCFAGISGDMNLAAFIDLGVDASTLASELKKLGLSGWKLKVSKSSKNGIFGTKVDVVCGHDGHHHGDHHEEHHHHRSFLDIRKIIAESTLSENVKSMATDIFRNLAEAEASVHGKTIDEVHFHEVGAVDSIVDIVGCAIASEILGVDKFVSSVVELGSGTVKCAHGVLPVPAPATAILAKNFQSKIGGAGHECTTPTGAAIIATLCGGTSEKISGNLVATGIGIGHRDCKELPNILRVMLYDTDVSYSSDTHSETMSEISANIDDMRAEYVAELCQKLFDAGALDVWQENIFMKKGRLGVKVCALSAAPDCEKIKACFFEHSTTLGLREAQVSRVSIPREQVVKKTSFGSVRFKKSAYNGVVRAKPEFEDCKKISLDTGIPIDVVSRILSNEF